MAMTFHVKHPCWPLCPACGWFGAKARRRAREAKATILVDFHAHLADQARRARQPREVKAPIQAWEWHQHSKDEPCVPTCILMPAGEQITTFFPAPSHEDLAHAEATIRRLFG